MHFEYLQDIYRRNRSFMLRNLINLVFKMCAQIIFLINKEDNRMAFLKC